LSEVPGLVVAVGAEHTRLTGDGIDLTVRHDGLRQELIDAVYELNRLRGRAHPVRREALRARDPGDAQAAGALQVGRMLADAFLPGAVGSAVSEQIRLAASRETEVALGISSERFIGLPWETLAPHEFDGSLALHPGVRLYRKIEAPTVPAPRGPRPGGLRVAVAIASPTYGGGPLLDYERELTEIMNALAGARANGADLRIVRYATLDALRECLSNYEPHVLHLSAHGTPGTLSLEHEDGRARIVDAAEFVASVLSGNPVPDLVSLAACSTSTRGGELPAFSTRLVAAGVPVVVGAESSVTDRFITLFFSELYGALAESSPDVLGAAAAARRRAYARLRTATEPLERGIAALNEWMVVTVEAADATSWPAVGIGHSPSAAARGLPERHAGGAPRPDFVGRRAEQRKIMRLLPRTAVAICGIGGLGKSALARRIAADVGENSPFATAVQLVGRTDVPSVLTAIADALELSPDHGARCAAPWRAGFAALSAHLSTTRPLMLVLDDFDPNLPADIPLGPDVPAPHAIDADLDALLGACIRCPQVGLVLTCRRPVAVSDPGAPAVEPIRLDPLSYAETRKLMWSLPFFDRFDAERQEHVWLAFGGHPYAWIHLSEQSVPDLHDDLNDALDVTIDACWALAEGDERFSSLATDPDAPAVLLALSMFRVPVPIAALSSPLRSPADPVQEPQPDVRDVLVASPAHALPQLIGSGLLCCSDEGMLTFHRWSTGILRERVIGPTETDRLYRLQYGAARYWLERIQAADTGEPSGSSRPMAGLASEAYYHLINSRRAHHATWVVLALSEAMCNLGKWSEADFLIRRHLQLDGLAAEDRAALIARRGHIADARGAYDAALRHFQEALRLFGETDTRTSDSAINQMRLATASLHQDRGDYEAAQREFIAVLRAARESGDRDAECGSLYRLAILAELGKDYPRAQAMHLEVLRLAVELGDRITQSHALHQLGMIAQFSGNLAHARRYYLNAVALRKAVGNVREQAMSVAQLGILAGLEGNWGEARSLIHQALDVFLAVGDTPHAATSSLHLGRSAHAMQEFDLAEQHLKRALTAYEQLGKQPAVLDALHRLAVLKETQRDLPSARECYRRHIDISRNVADRSPEFGAYLALYDIALVEGDYAGAAEVLTDHIEALSRAHGGQRAVNLEVPYYLALAGEYAEADRLADEIVQTAFRPEISDPEQLRAVVSFLHGKIEACRSALEEERITLQSERFGHHLEAGNKARDRNEFHEASRNYTMALLTAERMIIESQNPEHGIDLAIATDNLGDLALHVDQLSVAERWYERSLAVRSDLTGTIPGNSALRRGLAVTFERLAMVDARLGRTEHALRRVNESIAIRQELLESDPTSGELATDLAISIVMIAAIEPAHTTETRRRIVVTLERVDQDGGLGDRGQQILAWARNGGPAEIHGFRVILALE
jgi:tetratricopeptide (TPR) repeat protein